MSSSDLLWLESLGLPPGRYALFINGELVEHQNRIVRLEYTAEKELNFFTYRKTEFSSAPVMERDTGEIEAKVKKTLDSNELFDFNFSGWFSASKIDSTRSLRIHYNTSLEMIMFETLPYYVLKVKYTEESRRTSTISGDEGQVLDILSSNLIREKFRERGFRTYMRIADSSLLKRAVRYRGLNRVNRMTFIAFYQIDHLYHPLWDDYEIKEDFLNTDLGRLIVSKIDESGRRSRFTFLMHAEASLVLRVGGSEPRLLHFKHNVLMSLLVAKYLAKPDPLRFPVRGERIYFNTTRDPRLVPLINHQDWLALPSDVREENYQGYDSFNFYWMVNREYLKRFGLTAREINDQMLINITENIVV